MRRILQVALRRAITEIPIPIGDGIAAAVNARTSELHGQWRGAIVRISGKEDGCSITPALNHGTNRPQGSVGVNHRPDFGASRIFIIPNPHTRVGPAPGAVEGVQFTGALDGIVPYVVLSLTAFSNIN